MFNKIKTFSTPFWILICCLFIDTVVQLFQFTLLYPWLELFLFDCFCLLNMLVFLYSRINQCSFLKKNNWVYSTGILY